MTKRKRAEVRWLIACLSCCIAPAVMADPLCVDSNPLARRSAVSLASVSPGDGGIGGTGRAPAGPEDGGLGGTGVRGDGAGALPVARGESMGIVGVVTGFASVCVNGLEVHIDDATPVSENGRTAHVGNLAVGQFLSIDARATAGGLRASDIAIVHLIEGPLSARPGGGFAVMGQPIELLENARVDDPGALTPGRMVKVSGMRAPDGQIRATRIELAHGLNEVSVLGDITRNPGEPANIEGLRLRGNVVAPSGTAPSTQVLARGRWDGESLVATTIAADPTFRFTSHTDKVVLEALVSGSLLDGNITACGLSVKGRENTVLKGVTAATRLDVRRVRISGYLDANGTLGAERIDADLPAGLDPARLSVGQGGRRHAPAQRHDAQRDSPPGDELLTSVPGP
jgi:hypothetical protein